MSNIKSDLLYTVGMIAIAMLYERLDEIDERKDKLNKLLYLLTDFYNGNITNEGIEELKKFSSKYLKILEILAVRGETF